MTTKTPREIAARLIKDHGLNLEHDPHTRDASDHAFAELTHLESMNWDGDIDDQVTVAQETFAWIRHEYQALRLRGEA